MSANSPDSSRDPDSPTARLNRYSRDLTLLTGDSDMEKFFYEAANSLDNLNTSLADQDFPALRLHEEGIAPPPWAQSGLTEEDWLRVWNLAPMRLLARDYPRLEETNKRYINGVFRAAFKMEYRHDADCFRPEDDSRINCERSVQCPALVVRDLAFRSLQVIMINGLIAQEVDDNDAIARNDELVAAYFDNMTRYKLLRGEQDFASILAMTDQGAKEFLPARPIAEG
jgi:hypothetical protein